MSKETMMNNVIRKYGFEDSTTILFCEMCENNDFTLEDIDIAYQLVMS